MTVESLDTQPKAVPDRRQLSPDRILVAAIELMDAEGMACLTMRKLGRQLGVEAMSLYRYFPSKEALLAAASDRLFSLIEDPAADDPIDSLRLVMMAFFELAEDHPCLVDLLYLSATTPGKSARGAVDRANLARAGFAADASLVLRTLIGFTLGVLRQRRFEPRTEREHAFRFGLEMLLSGVRQESKRRAAKSL